MKRVRIVPIVVSAATFAGGAVPAHAQVVPTPGYSVTTFATGPAGTSGADSVEVIGGNIYVGYSNGTPKDGTAYPPGSPNFGKPAVSTIVEYNRNGAVIGSTQVAGHTDGLRYNPVTNQIWSMQNEDGNTNVVLITPGSLAKSAPIALTAVNGSGGFDDILFTGGKTYLTASNPSNSPNTNPAIVSAVLSGGTISTTPVLAGNVTATVLNSGPPATQLLNLQDPDSISMTVNGQVVMTSQGDGQLIFVNGIGGATQSVGVLNLTTFVDDTVFGGTSIDTLLVADKTTNAIYAITGPFNPNYGYSAAADTNGQNGFIGLLNTSAFGNGSLAPIVTGLDNPGGEAFLPAVPEPSTWAMMVLGFGAIGIAMRRRRKPFFASAQSESNGFVAGRMST